MKGDGVIIFKFFSRQNREKITIVCIAIILLLSFKRPLKISSSLLVNRADFNTPPINSSIYRTIFEGPMDFRNQELLIIGCRTPHKAVFSQIHMPVPYNLSNSVTSIQERINLYNTYFYSRPELILHGGHNVLIKLENIIFQDVHGKVSPDGRYRAFHSFGGSKKRAFGYLHWFG